MVGPDPLNAKETDGTAFGATAQRLISMIDAVSASLPVRDVSDLFAIFSRDVHELVAIWPSKMDGR